MKLLMKYAILLLLTITSYNTIFAQNRDNIYADLSLNLIGGSATYDRKLTKHLDIGVGTNIYNDTYEKYNNIRSAFYLDLRPYIKTKKSLFFFPVDAGIGLFTGARPTTYNMSGRGVYGGFGFGYARLINKRGMGPYVAITLNGSSASYHSYDMSLAPDARNYSIFDADAHISLGFKF